MEHQPQLIMPPHMTTQPDPTTNSPATAAGRRALSTTVGGVKYGKDASATWLGDKGYVSDQVDHAYGLIGIEGARPPMP